MPYNIEEIEEYREKAREQVIEIIKKFEEMLDEKYSSSKIKELKKRGYKFEYQIIPRIKSVKSILRKFEKHQIEEQDRDLTKIPDIIGLRIIVPTVKDIEIYIKPLIRSWEGTTDYNFRYLNKNDELELHHKYYDDDESCLFQHFSNFNGFNVEIQITTPEMSKWMDETHDEYVLRTYGEEYKEDTGLGR